MSNTMDCVIAYVMAANREEAEKISRAIVEEKLVACANLVDGVRSAYWWRGKVERADEVLVIAKTTKDMIDRVISRVRELHSYEVPEIIFLPIVAGNDDYLRWIQQSINNDQ